MLALHQAGARLPVSSLLSLSPALLRTLTTFRSNDDELDAEAHDKKYVDRLKITARAGKGGNGCVSFYQGASRGRHATADGGSGGHGGSIVVRAVSNMKSLAGVQQLYKAEPGGHGTRQRQHGRAGHDTVVLVPVGTVVQRLALLGSAQADGSVRQGAAGAAGRGRAAPAAADQHGHQQQQQQQQQADAEAGELPDWLRRWRRPFTGADYSSDSSCEEADLEVPPEPPGWAAPSGAGDASLAPAGGSVLRRGEQYKQQYGQQNEVLADLTEQGQEVVVARGGAGGRGNAGIKARAHRPAPADAERGQPGETCQLLLELKLLADVGLVGLPNAGKSTLLRALTAATPRVGAYAFTTLAPQLGVLPAPSPGDDPIVIADIPGLIQGAHENRGLGHHFLRHIERTKALAFVLDCSTGTAGAPGPRSWEQLEMLQEELAAYSPRLASLPALVVANKAETLPAPARTLAALQRRTQLPVVALSAKERKMLLPAGTAAGGTVNSSWSTAGAAQRHEWAPGLQLLHFRLARLLWEAGARQDAPHWEEYAAAQQQHAEQ